MKSYKNPVTGDSDIEMKKHLTLDDERIQKMLDIKLKVFNKELTPGQARILVNETFDQISAEEFAYGEQHLYNAGITDEIMAEGMDDIIDVFRDVLTVNKLNLPSGHPIQTYADEAAAIQKVVHQMEAKLKGKFIKNEWLELYAKLSQINTHFSRKQHQLFSALERKGFDRPSKIMWTFDDRVRDAIKDAYELLQADKDQAFLEAQPHVIHLVYDILSKERDVLYPTSLKLISDEEFVSMRISDDEIGYCLIENPPSYKGTGENTASKSVQSSPENEKELLSDLQAVLRKHGISGGNTPQTLLDVTTGKITLEQINLIYKHLQVDLSIVDENDEVRFYTDTKHRIFPRSAGVIGRKVQNCHPRESLHMVEAIINAFRKGEQDTAEFWLDKGDKFIYILFTALRDEQGNYRGTLESMQEVAHIRSLKGSRRLLQWDDDHAAKNRANQPSQGNGNRHGITPQTMIARLIEQYPALKDYMVTLSPEFEKLNNPAIFNTMKEIATLEVVSQVGGFEVEELMKKIITFIDNQS
ncbi:MAG: PAS domain-containing protein [Lentimicrobiaceae bacterium]|nr:PAS domain-containing protein [Lentimicrobiaceae bacterium]